MAIFDLIQLRDPKKIFMQHEYRTISRTRPQAIFQGAMSTRVVWANSQFHANPKYKGQCLPWQHRLPSNEATKSEIYDPKRKFQIWHVYSVGDTGQMTQFWCK